MTMRLDIVTNDAGELVRREHARELGAGVVVAIYRLAKLAQLHDLANQAFTRQLEQTHHIIGDYCLRSGSNVNVLFAHRAVFVAGQLLKGSRGTYEAASEFGELLERLGGAELSVQRDVTREELLAFAEQISVAHRNGFGAFRSPTPKIRLRPVTDAARLRGLELESLTPEQRIVRTYASAVVVMRRFFEDLNASRYILPRRIKRIAQSLVDLSEGQAPAFLGVTEVRNANFDEAGRAVNSAILAVAMARELTSDRAVLSQIAMAAMMHDVARPRALALTAAAGPAMPGMQGPTSLSEDQEDRLAAGSAAVLTALGRVNEPSICRTVLTFEALWLRRATWLGPVYWGAREATLHAKLIAVARLYNDVLTPEPGLAPEAPDYAVAVLSEKLSDVQDRTVLRMLVSALGLLPKGTVVQLATGEVAEVVRGPRGHGEKPRVRIVTDAVGQPAEPIEIELVEQPHRAVARILAVDGWQKGLADRAGPDASFGSDPPPADVEPPSHSASKSIAEQYAEQYAAWGDEDAGPGLTDSSSSIQSGASVPSLGSSPSAVAQAMGRMLDGVPPSASPPPAPARVDNDRTLFQGGPAGLGDVPSPLARPPSVSPREPTARGDLASTPLPHVLVYMLDHGLTGSVVFDGGGTEDTISFVDGLPTKVRLGDSVALLGEVLVHAGACDAETIERAVEGASRLGILLGEYLVGHDLVSREALSWALEAQLLNKVAYLTNLPPEVTYAYYRGAFLLEGWGGDDVTLPCPLDPILASVRNWTDRARIRATLNRVGKHLLVVHPESVIDGMSLTPEEQAALEVIRADSPSLDQLLRREVAPEEVVSSLVYTLAVTRQFAFKGQVKPPMKRRGAARFGSLAPVSVSEPPPSRSSVAASSASREVAAFSLGSAEVPALGSMAPASRSGGAAEAVAPVDSPSAEVVAAAGASPSDEVRALSSAEVRALAPDARGRGPRAIAPAQRPPASTGARPQIRPIAARKPGAPPAPTTSGPAAPRPSPAGAAPGSPARTSSSGPSAPRPSSSGPASGAPRAATSGPTGPSAPRRPSPGLPSKAAVRPPQPSSPELTPRAAGTPRASSPDLAPRAAGTPRASSPDLAPRAAGTPRASSPDLGTAERGQDTAGDDGWDLDG